MNKKEQVDRAYGTLRKVARHRLIPDVQTVEAIGGDAWKNAFLAFSVINAPIGEKNDPFFSRYRYRIQKVFGHKHYHQLLNNYQRSKSK